MTMLEKAQSLIGTPYDEITFNCYTLAQQFYPELLTANAVHKNLTRDVRLKNDELERLKKKYVEVNEKDAREGDLILRQGSHLGVIIGDNLVIHTNKKLGTAIEDIFSFTNGYNDIKFIRVVDDNNS